LPNYLSLFLNKIHSTIKNIYITFNFAVKFFLKFNFLNYPFQILKFFSTNSKAFN